VETILPQILHGRRHGWTGEVHFQTRDLQGGGIIARPLGRHFDLEPMLVQGEIELLGGAQQCDGFNLALGRLAGGERGDDGGAAGPGLGDGVEVVAFDGESVINRFGGAGGRGIRATTATAPAAGRAFGGNDPGVRSIDGNAIISLLPPNASCQMSPSWVRP